MSEAVVRVQNVSTWLGDRQVLRKVNLTVDGGEVVALLGGNGSGKTTLLRTLLGLIPHQQGSVTLFGRPIGCFRDWARVGYVPQRGRLQVPNATVHEVVQLGRLARRRWFELPNAADREAVAEALHQVGLAGFDARPMTWLSGGQQQRVLIARALAGQADLLVLDEPLAALDVQAQTDIAHLLGRLHGHGLTILVVLHELGAMRELLQRSVVLQAGRVVHDGPRQPDAEPVCTGIGHPSPPAVARLAAGYSIGSTRS